MSSDVESQDGELPTSPEDDLRELEEAYAALRDESQQLINERTTLEAEFEHFGSVLNAWMKTSIC